MSILSNDPNEGEARRDAAIRLLAAKRPIIMRRLQRAAVIHAIDIGTVDDIRVIVPIPPDINPTVTGAALIGLADLGILRGGDYVRSRRPLAHARPIRVWHLVDRATAATWLVAHPDYPAII